MSSACLEHLDFLPQGFSDYDAGMTELNIRRFTQLQHEPIQGRRKNSEFVWHSKWSKMRPFLVPSMKLLAEIPPTKTSTGYFICSTDYLCYEQVLLHQLSGADFAWLNVQNKKHATCVVGQMK